MRGSRVLGVGVEEEEEAARESRETERKGDGKTTFPSDR